VDRPFDDDALELCEAVGGLAGPMLEVHRREDQWLPVRVYWWFREKLEQLVGPGHLGFKLAALIAAAAALFLLFFNGDYRVAAETALEPVIQQAAVAPFNGYIREAPVRAGDLVTLGTVLAVLDDRELKLERLKHLSEQEEQLKQYRQAMAEHSAAQVQIVGAQLEQTRAQVLDIARNTAALVELGRDITDDDLVLIADYAYPAYGVPSAETNAAIRLAARTEGMMTDPVYEGKSMQGMIDLVRKGYFPAGSKVLYAHLGGVPAINAYSYIYRNG
jgi:multidrug efflux pump subunit AcrA (membrane-fusion protein)